jgi:hypothetical protein
MSEANQARQSLQMLPPTPYREALLELCARALVESPLFLSPTDWSPIGV